MVNLNARFGRKADDAQPLPKRRIAYDISPISYEEHPDGKHYYFPILIILAQRGGHTLGFFQEYSYNKQAPLTKEQMNKIWVGRVEEGVRDLAGNINFQIPEAIKQSHYYDQVHDVLGPGPVDIVFDAYDAQWCAHRYCIKPGTKAAVLFYMNITHKPDIDPLFVAEGLFVNRIVGIHKKPALGDSAHYPQEPL